MDALVAELRALRFGEHAPAPDHSLTDPGSEPPAAHELAPTAAPEPEPALLSPRELGPEPGPRRWAGFVGAAMLAFGVVLGALGSRWLGGAAELRAGAETAGATDTDTDADGLDADEARPDELDAAPDATVDRVLGLIAAGRIAEADLAWRREWKRRYVAKEDSADDSVQVARAFLDVARAEAKATPQQALEAAAFARYWASSAARELASRGEDVSEARLIENEATQLGIGDIDQ